MTAATNARGGSCAAQGETSWADKLKTLRQAAVEILQELGPLHYQELTDRILERGLASSSSQTPAASLNAMIAVDIKCHGSKSEFVRIRDLGCLV